MADQIAELAHAGQKHFIFEDMLGDEDLRVLMIRTVAEMLDRREDLAEVRDHYLGIRGQADFTVTAKSTQEMKLYCPLEIQAEPQIYETDWDAPYEDDLEVIPSSCACGCEDEINEAIEKYSEPEEKHRGLMVYYDANSPVNEKVVSAFPSVEVRNGELVGVLTCQITEPLTESEMSEFKNQLRKAKCLNSRTNGLDNAVMGGVRCSSRKRSVPRHWVQFTSASGIPPTAGRLKQR